MPKQSTAHKSSSLTASSSVSGQTIKKHIGSGSPWVNRIISNEPNQGITSGRKVFTDTAKALVKKCLEDPKVTGKEHATNPSSMLPSLDEDEYSVWCSICEEKDSPILLCAGCRVGICHRDMDGIDRGCLKQEAAMSKPDFVFYCPYCCQKGGQQFKFTAINGIPEKESLLYKYITQETLDIQAPPRSTSLPSSVGTSPAVTPSPTTYTIIAQPVEQPREVGVAPVDIGQRAPRIFPEADRPEKRLRNDSFSLGSGPGSVKKQK